MGKKKVNTKTHRVNSLHGPKQFKKILSDGATFSPLYSGIHWVPQKLSIKKATIN